MLALPSWLCVDDKDDDLVEENEELELGVGEGDMLLLRVELGDCAGVGAGAPCD